MKTPLGRFFKKYSDDQIGNLAAIIAYNTLFSMFPILLSILTITSFFTANPVFRSRLIDLLPSIIPDPNAAKQVADFINLAGSNAGLLGIFSLIVLLWSGRALIGSIELGLDTIFRVRPRDFLPQTGISFGLIFVFAILALTSIAASSAGTLVNQFAGLTLPGGFELGGFLQAAAGYLLSFVSAFILFFILYWILPNKALNWRHTLPGTLFSTVLFLVIVQVFPFYVANFGRFNRYGALIGLFLLVMTWFYFLAQILLLGAEVNSFLFPKDLGKDTRVLCEVAGAAVVAKGKQPPE